MKSNVEARRSAFEQNLSKFAARWHQLKPGNDILESSDRVACQQAVTAIKERKQEFSDLDKTRAKIM